MSGDREGCKPIRQEGAPQLKPPRQQFSQPGALLFAFFLCTYIATWACFVSAGNISPKTLPGAGLLLLGTIMPSLVAIGLTAWSEGRTGVRRWLCRVIQWHVALRWYLFAAGYVAAIKLTVAV